MLKTGEKKEEGELADEISIEIHRSPESGPLKVDIAENENNHELQLHEKALLLQGKSTPLSHFREKSQYNSLKYTITSIKRYPQKVSHFREKSHFIQDRYRGRKKIPSVPL